MKRPKREDYYIAGETDYEIALESYIDHLEELCPDVSNLPCKCGNTLAKIEQDDGKCFYCGKRL